MFSFEAKRAALIGAYVSNLSDRLVEELELWCEWAMQDGVGHSIGYASRLVTLRH